MMKSTVNSLQDDRISKVLNRLHREADKDSERWARDPSTTSNALVRMGEIYLSVSKEEGTFLYILARACKAKHLVEFGASYGVSTLYLAAAARDNGGKLVTTEAHPKKCAALRKNLDRAGLAGVTELFEGDARETLSAVKGPVDFLFLDGWKGMYRTVFGIVQPVLATGAVIVADNITHSAVRDYRNTVRNPNSGFLSVNMGKQEVSIKV